MGIVIILLAIIAFALVFGKEEAQGCLGGIVFTFFVLAIIGMLMSAFK